MWLAEDLHGQRQVTRGFHAIDQNQLGPVGAHRRLALGGGVAGHDQNHPITFDRRGHGQGDPGIAGRSLDQRVTGANVATQFGATDHRQSRTILDRTGRVVAL